MARKSKNSAVSPTKAVPAPTEDASKPHDPAVEERDAAADAQRAATTRSRRTRDSNKKAADERNQILSLLSLLAVGRCGVKMHEISAVTGLRDDPKKAYDPLGRFLDGTENLGQDSAEALIGWFRKVLTDNLVSVPASATGHEHILARDLLLLRSVVQDVIKFDCTEATGLDDQRHADREFLRLLGMEINPQEQQKVFGYLSGFWFLIRFSTESGIGHAAEPQFTVSLLSVKEHDYLAIRENTLMRMMTAVPHFSLRVRPWDAANGERQNGNDKADDRNSYIYRGRVVATPQHFPVLNFIGNVDVRERAPRLHLMTLNVNNLARATEALGVAITSNKHVFFSGPIGACYVPWGEEIDKLLATANASLERRKQISECIRHRRDELKQYINRYDEKNLIAALENRCAPGSLAGVLRGLKDARQEASEGLLGGNHKVPD